DCLICDRIALAKQGANPYFIHEFPRSIFVVGDHQFHKGYCVLLLKDHVREMHELPANVARELVDELMIATRAVVSTFGPWKINHACSGTAVPHIHWHIFPRYESDPDHLNHPWLHASEFKNHEIDAPAAREIARQIRANLPT